MTSIKLGAKIEDMAKQLYSFRFSPDLMKEVDRLAKKENRNLTNYIETLLIKTVEESKKNKSRKY